MLIEKAKNPEFWRKAATEESYAPFRAELEQLWEKNCTGDIPAVRYSEYVIYWQNGSRGEYESSYFRRRRALNTAALLAMLYPEREEYMVKLCDVMWAILDEYSWVLPAHSGALERAPEPAIDLFAAETGFTLAEIDYILGDRLPPLLRRRTGMELERRIIGEFLNNYYYGWEDSRHNWGPVCAGSVCAVFLYRAPERFPLIRARIENVAKRYLSGFKEDGVCLEGFSYWHYGFGYYLSIADLLRSFTGGELDLLSDPKVRAVAAYPYNVQLGGGLAAPFADAGADGRLHIGLAHYLKHEFSGLPVPPRRYTYTNDACGRWALHLRALLWFDPELAEDEPGELDYYAPGAQLLVRRRGELAAAVKGGDNNEPHNHNDLGGFVVASGGRQLIADPGPGVYSAAYFSSARYEDFSTSSRGHSVPIIDGQYQREGAESYAEARRTGDGLELDISRAYRLPEGSVLRSFSFGEGRMTVSDSFRGTKSVTERFITACEPVACEGGLALGELRLSWRGGGEAKLAPAPKKGFWCIDIPVPESSFELEITYRA